jgi:hypothetical protein
MRTKLSLTYRTIVIALVLFASESFGQAVFTSKITSGTWNSSTSWNVIGFDEDGIPDANDSVYVSISDTNHTITIPSQSTAECFVLQIGKAKSGTGGGIVLLDSSSLITNEIIVNQPSNGTRFLSIGTGNVVVNGDIALNSVNIVSSGRISKVTITTGNLTVRGNILFNARVADNAVIDMTADSASLNIGKHFIVNPKGTVLSGLLSSVIFDGMIPQIIPLKIPTIQFNNIFCKNSSSDGVFLDSTISPSKISGDFFVVSGHLHTRSFNVVGNSEKILGIGENATICIGTQNSTNGFPTGFSTRIHPTSTTIYEGGAQIIEPVNKGYGNLILEGTTPKICSDTIIVKGHLKIRSPLSTNNLTLLLLGNLSNDFPKLSIGGTTLFTGNRNSSIGGNEKTHFETLLLNSSNSSRNITLLQDISATNFTLQSGTFNLGNFSLEGDGNFILADETIFQLRGTQKFPSNYAHYNLQPLSTVEYRGAVQNVNAVPGGYGNLTLTGFDTKTIIENISIKSNFIFDCNVDAKKTDITMYGNWINRNGIFTSQGNVIFAEDHTSIQGTPTAFHNILIEQNAETVLEQNISADNIEIAGKLNAQNYTITTTNNFSLGENAVLRTVADNSFGNFYSSIFSLNSTVEFAGNSEQLIPNYKYGTIRCSGTGQKKISFHLLAHDIHIAADATLNAQYFPITVTGNWNNNGIFISSNDVIFQGRDQIISSSIFSSVRFNGNGTKSAAGNIIVKNDITIDNGVTFDGGSYHHFIGRNWNNNGIFFSSGIVECNGAEQRISSSTFHTIIFSGEGIKKIEGNLTIGGNVHILARVKVAGSNHLFTIFGNWKNDGTFMTLGEVNFAGDIQTISSSEFFGLHLSGTGNKIALGNLTMQENFIVDAGTQFSAGEFTHTMSGNIISHQNINEETSTFIFNGNSPQTISSLTVFNAQVNNAAGIFLAGQLSIINSLLITAGDIQTDNHFVEIRMHATLTETPGNRIIGKVFSLRPIEIGAVQNFGNIGLELLINGQHPGPTMVTRYTGVQLNGSENFPESQSIRRYFVVATTDNQNLNAQVIFHYDDEELQNQNEESIDIWSTANSGMQWKKYPVHTHRDTAANTDTIKNIPSLSLFTFADHENPLYGATIVVKKYFDLDGDNTTGNDRSAKFWNMKIHSAASGGNLISAVLNDSVVHADDIAKGMYIVSQADSFGWNNLGYRINGQFIFNTNSSIQLVAEEGLTTEIEFISSHRNSLIINNVWDTDGDISTIIDRKKKHSRIEFRTDSLNSTLIALVPMDSLLLLTNIVDGRYLITLSDTGNWQRLGYSINGEVIISNAESIPVVIEGRKILTVNVISFFPSKITVKKFRDPDGIIFTPENRELSSTKFALYKGPPEPQYLFSTTSAGEGFEFNNLGNGNYTLVELSGSTWKPLGYTSNEITINSCTKEISIQLQGGNIFDISYISFLPNTLSLSHVTDEDGDSATANDRTAYPWFFTLYKDSVSNATQLATIYTATSDIDSLVDGTYCITRYDSAGFVPIGYTASEINSYDSVHKSITFSLTGGEKNFRIQFVSYVSRFKKFRTFAQEKLGGKSLALRSTPNSLKPFGTRMPSAANIRDSIFKNYITPKLSALVLGVEQATKEKQRQFGWVKLSKSQKKFAPHTSAPKEFTHKKELKNPIVSRINNKLVGELYALKLAIAASDFGMTPSGLGEIIFDDGTGNNNPFNGKTLREIAPLSKAGKIDSVLTFSSDIFNTTLSYEDIFQILHKINRAFEGLIDTVSTDPLIIKGTIPLATISFLQPSLVHKPEDAPHNANSDIPKLFFLEQNYPNPFNPTTTFEYTLATSSIVTIKIFNLLGQEVATIMNNEEYPEGTYQTDFSATTLSSGTYFYRLTAIPTNLSALPLHLVKKMVLVK